MANKEDHWLSKDVNYAHVENETEKRVTEKREKEKSKRSQEQIKTKNKAKCEEEMEEKYNTSKLATVAKVGFVLIGFILVIFTFILLTASILGAIVSMSLEPEFSVRSAGMTVIAVASGWSFILSLAGIIIIFKKKRSPLNVVSIGLLVIATILVAISLTAAIDASKENKLQLTRNLLDSFNLAVNEDPKHAKKWEKYQFQLNCCGINGPDDYHRGLPQSLPAEVPVTCCPGYNLNKNNIDQEKLRLACNQRREYYNEGCKDNIVAAVFDVTVLVLVSMIAVIICSFIEAALGLILAGSLKTKNENKK